MADKILIVVDMQNDFVTGALKNKDAEKIVPDVAKYIKEFRETNGDNGKIIFTRDSHFEDYLESPEGKKLPIEHCLLNSKGWQIVDEIDVKPTDIIVNKPTFGFEGWKRVVPAAVNMIRKPTSEESAFNENDPGFNIEFTLIGVCTDICVVSNALLLKTAYPAAEVNIVRKLCAGVSPETHEAALKTMASCQCNII